MAAFKDNTSRRLAAIWSRWTKIVGTFAKGRGGSLPSGEDYQTLRSELIALAQQPAEENSKGPRETLDELAELLAPWVTLESLARAPRLVMQDVLKHAQRLQCQLEGRDFGKRRRPWKKLALLLAVGILIPIPLAAARIFSVAALPGRETLDEIWWMAFQRWLVAGANLLSRCGPCEFAVIVGVGEAAAIAPLLWFFRNE